jgi:hypothetical protein
MAGSYGQYNEDCVGNIFCLVGQLTSLASKIKVILLL